MNLIKRANKKVWIVLIILLVVEALFDPIHLFIDFSEKIQAQIGLRISRIRWENSNVNNYSFEITTGITTVCMPSAQVEVRNGKVFRVFHKDNLITMEISKTPLPRTLWANHHFPNQFFCDYANFTMPQIFDMMERSLRGITRISFDMRYGFISGVRWGSPGGWGLLNPRVSDCCSGFSISNFQVLDNEP